MDHRSQEIGQRLAAADYVAALSADLAEIARSNGLDTLGFLLEMARLEAQNAIRAINGTCGNAQM
jgi:hypothetical protein